MSLLLFVIIIKGLCGVMHYYIESYSCDKAKKKHDINK